jgi:hypothetical protein
MCVCLTNQHHQYRQETEKRFVYLITDKVLFFALCCWCNQTHPIASLFITCIQIVTSFFSFTKNLKKKINMVHSEAAKSITHSVICCLSQLLNSCVMCHIFYILKIIHSNTRAVSIHTLLNDMLVHQTTQH